MRLLTLLFAVVCSASAQIISFSSRQYVGTDSGETVIDFVIPDGDFQTVLIRHLGPALAQYGVSGVIVDPALQLLQGSTELATNTDWDSSLSSAFNSVGAFALNQGSNDAALLATLTPGSYTVRFYGEGGVTGVGLTEIYVVGSGLLSGVSLQALTTSAQTQLIGGIVISPSASELLVRASGAGLGGGWLTDPSLTVYSSGGGVITANDNWTTSADYSLIAGYSSQLGLLALAGADGAALVEAGAGAYTAMAKQTGATGLVKLEIFDVSNVSAIPEPATVGLLLGAGTMLLAVQKRRRRT